MILPNGREGVRANVCMFVDEGRTQEQQMDGREVLALWMDEVPRTVDGHSS